MKKQTTFFIARSIVVLMVFIAASAWALDIRDAKTQGLVGETASGYIEAVNGSANAEVSRLISTINQQRKTKYQQIAKKNNISLDAVETRAGEVSIQKTSSGQYVKKNGAWQKK